MKSEPFEITDVKFVAAPPQDEAGGLLGFASIVLAGRLRLTSIAVRRSATGRLVLAFPARRDRAGRRRYLAHPLDDETRREIERQVFRALALKQEAD